MIDSVELLKKLQVKAGAKLWLINVPRPIAEAITAGAEVETVKAAVELPSPWAGVVAALHAEEGQTVPVGTPITIYGSNPGNAGPAPSNAGAGY